jgi:hypothetical protein
VRKERRTIETVERFSKAPFPAISRVDVRRKYDGYEAYAYADVREN